MNLVSGNMNRLPSFTQLPAPIMTRPNSGAQVNGQEGRMGIEPWLMGIEPSFNTQRPLPFDPSQNGLTPPGQPSESNGLIGVVRDLIGLITTLMSSLLQAVGAQAGAGGAPGAPAQGAGQPAGGAAEPGAAGGGGQAGGASGPGKANGKDDKKKFDPADLAGLTRKQAEKKIKEAGLKPRFVNEGDKIPADIREKRVTVVLDKHHHVKEAGRF